MNDPPGGYDLVANTRDHCKVFRAGTRLHIIQINGMNDRVRVSGVSRGGRRVTRWISLKRLTNPRIAWVFGQDADCAYDDPDDPNLTGRLERLRQAT